MTAPGSLTVSAVCRGLPSQEIANLDSKLLNQVVGGVASQSDCVSRDFIFVAIKGGGADGHDFIDKAVSSGAILIVGQVRPLNCGVPFLKVSDSRLALANLAANFYGNPSRKLLTIGVTGTSGKTTTTYLIESMLRAEGLNPGVIGTVNIRYCGKEIENSHTTPDAVSLQKHLSDMVKAGVKAVVMEVSSHALKQHRTAFTAFDGMVFTNLTPEHLDFHSDMNDYYLVKRTLFFDYAVYAQLAIKRPIAAINMDDLYGVRLADELAAQELPTLRMVRYGLHDSGRRLSLPGDALKIGLTGVSGILGDIPISSKLIGRFNAMNILAAVSLCRGLKLSPVSIAEGVLKCENIPGRMELVPNSKGVMAFVDYAHKPDALEKVLDTLREMRSDGQKIVCVVGCGGDRDKTKRPKMGAIAAKLSDELILTSDNPRTEDPEAILDEVEAGIPKGVRYQRVSDRKKAIRMAVTLAQKNDILLVAGKGHETYQIIGKSKIHFDDREEIIEALQ